MHSFTFDEQMIIHALEANGWRNVWDIYWIGADRQEDWGGLTMEDAFLTLLKEKSLLQREAAATLGPAEKRD
jgi:hypothetical protein